MAANTKTKILLEAEDRTRGAFDSAKSGLAGVATAASSANRLLATFGVGLSVVGLAAFIKSSIDAASSLGDLHTRTGLAVEQLAGLQLVAKQSDTSIEALGKGVNKLGIFMVENAAAAKKLELSAKDPLQAFIQLSAELSKIPDVGLRNAVANKALGKSYEELLPALLQGPEALRAQIEAGQRYNKITGEMAEQSQKFNNNLAVLKISASSLGVAVAQDMLPALTDITKAMIEAQKEGSALKTLWVGLGGLGAFLFTDEFAGVEKKIYNLNLEIKQLERRRETVKGGGVLNELLYGTEGEIDSKIAATRKQIEDLRASVAPRTSAAAKPTSDTDTGVAAAACSALGGVYRNGKCEVADEATKSRLKANASFVKGLRDEAAVLGMSAEAAERYKAAQMGLNAAQLASANRYIQQKADQKEAEQSLNDKLEAETAGTQLLIGLQKDFNNEIEKRRLALDAPLLSASQRALAESLLDVTKRAQDARVELEKLNVGGNISSVYAERLQEITDKEIAQRDAIKNLAAEQDKLNTSFEYGARVALRSYLDEVTNVARKSEALFTKAFRGAEDSLVNFAKTGKFEIRSLADSAISDLIRIQMRQGITGPLASFASSLLPKFEHGGVHAGGLRLVGERGPELEYTGPSRIFNATQTKNMLAGSGGDNIVINISVDANGSSVQGGGQNAAELGRMIGGAVRTVLIQEKRPGGLLT